MHLPDPFHDRYTNLRLLGRGGFGVVYRAWDLEMERDVALKLLNPDLASDPDWRKRFRQEATAASKLNHPNITIVFDRGEFEDRLYIVMEFVEGETLSKIIDQRVPLSDTERLLLIEQLCDGLHYAHQRHIVHRDIKPVNLIVHEDHDGTHLTRTLKILDFGIAKIVDAAQTATGAQLMFTPNYVSPEQIRGARVDRRCDIFAVGAVAYELMTLEKAFIVTTKNPFAFFEEVKRKIVEQPHRPLADVRPGISRELAAIIDRALAKNPEDRYQDLAEMRRHLRRIREQLQESQTEASSETTVTLNPATQAAVTAARHALDAGDPDAAVVQLEAALRSAPTRPVRRFLERSLEHARERQTARRAEEAIARAVADFQRGEYGQAIELLEKFQPGQMVAEQLAQLHRAALLIGTAERALLEGSAAARAAALYQLDQFVPTELTKVAAARLRARAVEKVAEEDRARERERSERIVTDARDHFRAGHIEEAMAVLDRADQPADVGAVREQLRETAALVQRAAAAVERGSRAERSRSLQALAGVSDQSLVESILVRLRGIDAARSIEEDNAAAALVAHEQALNDAATAIANARADFIGGRRAEAITALGRFELQELIGPALDELRTAQHLLERTTEAVQQGSRDARQLALAELSRFTPADLVAAAARELAEVAAERDANERRAEHQAVLARARHAVESAFRTFGSGNHRDAIASLEQFDDAGLVAEPLERLRKAEQAIVTASSAVNSGSRRARTKALDRLARYAEPELIAGALDDLRKLDQQRTTAEDHEAAALALIKSAQTQFDGGDRAAALARLAEFDPPHAEVAAVLAELGERARQLDEAESREQQARELIVNAQAMFMHGRRAEAIESVDAKRDLPGVSKALGEFRNADAAILRAVRVVEQDDEAARSAALSQLSRFQPSTLVAGALEALRETAARRSQEELERRKAQDAARVEEAARTAIGRAEAEFVAGRRDAAIQVLEGFSSPELVSARRDELRRLDELIARTEARIRTGDADDRQAALRELASAEPSALVAGAITSLEALAGERTAQKRKAEAEALVRRTIEQSRTLFDAGKRADAIAQLEQLSPRTVPVEEALSALRAESAKIEAERARLAEEAEENKSRARTLFVNGDVAQAIAILGEFREASLVLDALETFRQAASEIETARSDVTSRPAATRRAAIERLERLQPADLFRPTIDELRRLDAERTAEEARIEAARLSSEADRVSAVSRATFVAGDHDAAISALERFRPESLVDATLSQLRAARHAIQRAGQIMAVGDDAAREQAVAELTTFEPRDLVAKPAEQFHEEHLRRRADEERQRIERALAERAQRTVDEARQRFDAGEIDASLALLDAFAPPHPLVIQGLEDLRRTLRCRELVARAEEALTGGRLGVAAAAVLEARELRPDDGLVGELQQKIRTRQRSVRIDRVRNAALKFVLPGIAAAGIVSAVYVNWNNNVPATQEAPDAPVTRPEPTVSTPKQPERPEPVPGPTSKPPAPGGTDTAPPGPDEAAARLEKELQRIRRQATRLLAEGRFPQTLGAVERGLKIKGDDPGLRATLESMTGRASDDAAAARAKAESAGAPAVAGSKFQDGMQRQQRAGNDRSAGRLPNAVRGFWAARDAFSQAAKEATPTPATPSPGPPVVRGNLPDAGKRVPPPESPVVPPKPEPEPPKTPDRAPSAEAALRTREEAAIREVFRAYEAAYASKNVDALQRVQVLTSQQVREIRGAFADARTYRVTVSITRISFSDGRQATVAGQVTTTVATRVGGKDFTNTSPTTFTLEKRGEDWIIASSKSG